MKRGGRKGERLQGAAEFALRGLAQVLEAFARVVMTVQKGEPVAGQLVAPVGKTRPWGNQLPYSP